MSCGLDAAFGARRLGLPVMITGVGDRVFVRDFDF